MPEESKKSYFERLAEANINVSVVDVSTDREDFDEEPESDEAYLEEFRKRAEQNKDK